MPLLSPNICLLSTEHTCRDPCCNPFEEKGRKGYGRGYEQDVPSAEDYPDVHEHAHPYQKVWYEYGVAYELYACHETGTHRDETVQYESGVEGSENSFQPNKLREQACDENLGKDKYELGDAV